MLDFFYNKKINKGAAKRGLLKILAAIGLLAVLSACSRPGQSSTDDNTATKSIFAMDTYMTITAYGSRASEAVDAAVERVNELDELLSTGSQDSQISQLNQAKEYTLSQDVYSLTKRACHFYQDTDGAFNIAIYPVMQLWGFYTGHYNVPDDSELAAALATAHPENILFNDDDYTVTLPEDASIDLGGIAKGYTSASIMDIFAEYDCSGGIVSLGGNIQCMGQKADGSSYNIAIQNPDDSSSYLGYLTTKDEAVVTSGGYERYFEKDGRTYHHIIDPATGYPANNGLKSVSIVSKDGTMADALSTAIYIMGLDKATSYWRNHSDDFDMVLLSDDGKLYVTEGIAHIFTSDMDVKVLQ